MLKFVMAAVAAFFLCAVTVLGQAQVPPQQYVTRISLASGVTTTGTLTAIRAPAANKTFQLTSSVGATTGTTTVVIQGSNDATFWDPLATMTVTSSVAGASTSTTTTDRYLWLRANVTAAQGSTPTLSVTAGF